MEQLPYLITWTFFLDGGTGFVCLAALLILFTALSRIVADSCPRRVLGRFVTVASLGLVSLADRFCFGRCGFGCCLSYVSPSLFV
jgi:hypothetical protein